MSSPERHRYHMDYLKVRNSKIFCKKVVVAVSAVNLGDAQFMSDLMIARIIKTVEWDRIANLNVTSDRHPTRCMSHKVAYAVSDLYLSANYPSVHAAMAIFRARSLKLSMDPRYTTEYYRSVLPAASAEVQNCYTKLMVQLTGEADIKLYVARQLNAMMRNAEQKANGDISLLTVKSNAKYLELNGTLIPGGDMIDGSWDEEKFRMPARGIEGVRSARRGRYRSQTDYAREREEVKEENRSNSMVKTRSREKEATEKGETDKYMTQMTLATCIQTDLESLIDVDADIRLTKARELMRGYIHSRRSKSALSRKKRYEQEKARPSLAVRLQGAMTRKRKYDEEKEKASLDTKMPAKRKKSGKKVTFS